MPPDDLPVMSLWVQKLFGSSRFAECRGYAQGIYLLLLAREHGFRGRGLPSDDGAIARLVGLDKADWLEVKGEVMQFFVERDGRLFNDTCEEQIQEALQSKARIRAQRQTAAAARWGAEDAGRNAGAHAAALREDMQPQCPPSPSPSPSEDDASPPTPPKKTERGRGPPDGRPSACGGGIASLARKTLELTQREARRLLEQHPELTESDLRHWEGLQEARPDLFTDVRSPKAYIRNLAFRYGTVEAAGAAGPPKASDDARRDDALKRRSNEVLQELRTRPPGVTAEEALGASPAELLRQRRASSG